MTATVTIFYSISAFGLAYIVGHSVASQKIRETMYGNRSDLAPIRFTRQAIVDLLECPACFGFWTGIAMAMLHAIPFEVPHFNILAWGLFTAGSNYIIAKLTKLI